MNTFLQKIIQTGSNKNYTLWETQLITKLNRISLIGSMNMLLAIVFFLNFGHVNFVIDCVFGIIALPITILLNKFMHYLIACYWFFICGFLFFISINLKMGSGSYMILFYFPVILSMVQLLGREELMKHLIILSSICIVSIVVIVIGFKYKFFLVPIDEVILSNLYAFNIVLSFITTISLTLILVSDYIKQDNLIKKMLKEKELLLAEVFHRVKNNLNIVTSLLNLKKHSSESIEVQEALEECRARVYSMALVHQNIYIDNLVGLNFKHYIENLVYDIGNSLGNKENVDIKLEASDILLDMANAIPCGLILNEIITNSYKYGQTPGKKLQIFINLFRDGNEIHLIVKDNGPGFIQKLGDSKPSLGLELVHSLTEQLNGTASFENEDGFSFHLIFKQKH